MHQKIYHDKSLFPHLHGRNLWEFYAIKNMNATKNGFVLYYKNAPTLFAGVLNCFTPAIV